MPSTACSRSRAVIHLAAQVLLLTIVLFSPGALRAQEASPEATNPDVTVFDFTDLGSYGSADGYASYAVGTRSCNRGSTPLNWCDQNNNGCAAGATPTDHPVIAQNLYRLKSGRFEQVGMSWLKHGFVSTNSTTPGCTGAGGQTCTQPPEGGDQLGVGCTDPYQASLNSSRPLGRRSEVDASTGEFPLPNSPGGPYTVYDQRIRVATSDMDAAQNPGALYFAEAQYVAPDDAIAGNGLNNASYQRVTVGGPPGYSIGETGSFFEGSSAIEAWPAQDVLVERVNADVPGSVPLQRFQVARKVTNPSPGLWHYEYAIRNHNSDRAAQAFAIDFPEGTSVTNTGFSSIESHSGEPYSTTDWTIAVDAPTSVVSWSTETFATNPNANALRWATMYNFWFDADSELPVSHTLSLFKPGTPNDIVFWEGNTIFVDGFESNDTTAWSLAFP